MRDNPLTISELIDMLTTLRDTPGVGDLPVLVPGYESGYDLVSGADTRTVFDENNTERWWDGRYQDIEYVPNKDLPSLRALVLC